MNLTLRYSAKRKKMTMTTTSASELLEAWIAEDTLSSRYAERVAQLRSADPSLYRQALEAHGKEAAEKELQAWNQEGRRSDLAAMIEPAAQRLLAVTDSDCWHHVQAVTTTKITPRPGSNSVPCDMVVASEVWPDGALAEHGELKIRAVMLHVEPRSLVAYLGLILPHPASEAKESDFASVFIGSDGNTECQLYKPRALSTKHYLGEALGVRKISSHYVSDEPLVRILGRSDAFDYLVGSLPTLLDEYFGLLPAM